MTPAEPWRCACGATGTGTLAAQTHENDGCYAVGCYWLTSKARLLAGMGGD